MMEPGEILQQLDQCAEEFTFPMLDNGYVYPADVRLSIYRDPGNWLMVIELLGAYTPRASAYKTFQNSLYLFGSDLHHPPGFEAEDLFFPIEACAGEPLFPDPHAWYANDDARCVTVRGKTIQLNLSPVALSAKGIELLDPPRIDPAAILRSLLPEYRELLLASEAELAQRNKHNLPLWIRLEEWHHPDLAGGEKPSDSETFKMLAAAISSGDRTKYSPAKAPNTDWRNWPVGGAM